MTACPVAAEFPSVVSLNGVPSVVRPTAVNVSGWCPTEPPTIVQLPVTVVVTAASTTVVVVALCVFAAPAPAWLDAAPVRTYGATSNREAPRAPVRVTVTVMLPGADA